MGRVPTERADSAIVLIRVDFNALKFVGIIKVKLSTRSTDCKNGTT
jgi:hypothetical protein